MTASFTAAASVNIQQGQAVGDGVTDNTTFFATEIASGSSTVYVPDGTYIVTGITLNVAGQTLALSPGATIMGKAGTNATALITATAAGVTITGGRVNANRAGATFTNAILVSSAADCAIESVNVSGSQGAAIAGVDPPRLRVRKCYISNCGDNGISVTNSVGTIPDIEIIDNEIDRTAEGSGITNGGILVSGGNITSTAILDNTVRLPTFALGTSNLAYGTHIELTTGLVIKGNRLLGGARPIYCNQTVDGVIADNYCFGWSSVGLTLAAAHKNISITGNVLDGNGVARSCLSISDTAANTHRHDCVVSGNVFTGAVPTGGDCYFFSINGLTYAGNANDCLSYNSGTGNAVHFDTCQYVSMVGGSVQGRGLASIGFFLEATRYASVTGVSVDSPVNQGGSIYSDQTANAPLDFIAVSGCSFTGLGTGAGAMSIAAANGGSLGHNISVIGCTNFVINSPTAHANGNALRGDLLDALNDVWDFLCSASPNGSVTAGKGSTARNEAGGAGTTFFVNEAGGTVWVGK